MKIFWKRVKIKNEDINSCKCEKDCNDCFGIKEYEIALKIHSFYLKKQYDVILDEKIKSPFSEWLKEQIKEEKNER